MENEVEEGMRRRPATVQHFTGIYLAVMLGVRGRGKLNEGLSPPITHTYESEWIYVGM